MKIEAMESITWSSGGQHSTSVSLKRVAVVKAKGFLTQCPSIGLMGFLHLCDACYNLRASSLMKSQIETT